MSFALSKWYLDVVADDGALAIGYAARLRLGPLVVDYGSLLTCDAHGAVETRASLRRLQLPRAERGEVAWHAPALGVSVTARGREPGTAATLLERSGGAVVWTCHAPRAQVSFVIDGRPLHGLGYAEHVELTLPPWQLPIEELRWGRALTERRSLVWIDWRGRDHRSQLALADGERLGPVSVDDDGVYDDQGGVLVRLGEHTTLRQGEIGRTALGSLGREVVERLPASALLLQEHKWRSRAELAHGDHGYAIHEVVRWP